MERTSVLGKKTKKILEVLRLLREEGKRGFLENQRVRRPSLDNESERNKRGTFAQLPIQKGRKSN